MPGPLEAQFTLKGLGASAGFVWGRTVHQINAQLGVGGMQMRCKLLTLAGEAWATGAEVGDGQTRVLLWNL